MSLHSLPYDLTCHLTNYFPLYELFSLASTSSYFNEIMSKDEFWRLKCKNKKNEDQTWKRFYILNSLKTYTFGNNTYSQLGSTNGEQIRINEVFHEVNSYIGVFEPTLLSDFKFRDIAVSRHMIAIDIDNNLWVCGLNASSQLGLGHNSVISTPTRLHTEFRAKSVAAGFNHSAIIDTDNNLWMFGCNKHGQLGLNSCTSKFNTPKKISYPKCQQISLGCSHSVLIDMENNVWTCGNSTHGKLGLNYYNDRICFERIKGHKAKQISAGVNHTAMIDMDNNVWLFGKYQNKESNFPIQLEGIKAKYVSSGLKHIAIIDMADNVLMIGEYYAKVSNLKVKQVATGDIHTVIIDLDDNVWTFGSNSYGQLGVKRITEQAYRIPNLKAFKIAAGDQSTTIISV